MPGQHTGRLAPCQCHIKPATPLHWRGRAKRAHMFLMISRLLAVQAMPPTFVLFALMLVGVVVVSLLLARIRQSLLVGYFLCGVVIANSGLLPALGLQDAKDVIHQFADFGVILLLFTLGIELSLGELRYVRRLAFVGGGWQMALTMALAVAVALGALKLQIPHLVVLGMACALSSTAIPLKVFEDMDLASGPGARTALAVAIFQDLCVIVFLVLLPGLFPQGASDASALVPELGRALARGLIFVGISFVLARWVIPRLLHSVAGTRSRELFTLAVVGLCIGVALIAGLLQLSMVLGAFVAGLAVSESIFKHRIIADVMPLKDLFLTLFFVSVGLMIDLPTAWRNAPLILLVAGALMIVKSLIMLGVGRYLKLRWKTAVLAAFGLCSGGEFSLVLLQKVGQMKPWPGDVEQVMLAAFALSMVAVPMLMRYADVIGGWLEKWFPLTTIGELPPARRAKVMRDHAIICGYGPVGQALVTELNNQGIATLVIELNADTVRALHKSGQPVLFADAAHHETWELAGVDRARLVAFTFPNPEPAIKAVPLIRGIKPEMTVMARTKFTADMDKLQGIGVDILVLDEQESGRAAIRRALRVFEQGEADVPI